jgi:hypothetical protein
MGLDASDEEVLTPAVTAVGWMRERGVARPALFVPDATAGEFADLETGVRPDAVLDSLADLPAWWSER